MCIYFEKFSLKVFLDLFKLKVIAKYIILHCRRANILNHFSVMYEKRLNADNDDEEKKNKGKDTGTAISTNLYKFFRNVSNCC